MPGDEEITGKVAERLRFFYSDANIRVDKFLREELEKAENGGFVPITTLLKFKTIRKLTEDVKVIAEAAKHERVCERVKLNDDETGIGRKVPFDFKKMGDNVKLSLRVENLPVTTDNEGGKKPTKRYAVTMDEIRDLFTPYGEVALVRLQFYRSNWQKREGTQREKVKPGPIGAAFVEFETEEDVQKASAELCAEGSEEPGKVLELCGNKLKILTMTKWLEDKKEDKKERSKGETPKKREREEDKENEEKQEGSDGKKEETDGTKKDPSGDEKSDHKEFTLDWKTGHVISIKGLKDSCDREAILDAVTKFLGHSGDMKTLGVYADYSRGQPEGALRFKSENVAGTADGEITEKVSEMAAKLNDGSITIAGSRIESASVLEGEEEKTYYKNFIDFKNKQAKHRAQENPRKRGRKGRR
mmetsp:Transcript_12288/g.25546  ORF Transcript_12288/g.25546 Transcript_12288/m.25546 type:complete len:416 (-) Transcript_12288:180-1427(-)|eukprot:CAMPEP_0183307964 /NCGR_PEP_ID=MMETSP0160_2-20130417/19661_1 /TAXON_ID=2839 ORGANISM="Odontella Sinensis, Strain Grunow 1884" /NCGR_SAMPLE_ID=MMETSP0160_2 /ASSEMBLY_ACC=CAM_ASM_000250 /LENGTH=415 /DNA_ID=CAMNT_0025471691 /DNA_START=46 /DNA_END=1293 /DNA_ORIENTATION=+